ncbi:hypothetical protein Pla100_45360 [Neorhodopirellula pilleata]|uniref:Uncharacterized protein n=1 Tax=Neorhodopirellula pilleata TaxID=2714738 RepID=A0A5C5ZZZ9_9BACT|nr:hypothetical protein Pla100_45360 [Neorhodopirellula pilleata]
MSGAMDRTRRDDSKRVKESDQKTDYGSFQEIWTVAPRVVILIRPEETFWTDRIVWSTVSLFLSVPITAPNQHAKYSQFEQTSSSKRCPPPS